jgi:hypothetical protein
MADEKLDRKELAERVGNLMKSQTDPNPWRALGEAMARSIEARAWQPRLSVVRWFMFCDALDRNDEEALKKADENYENCCNEFIKRFGIDELWTNTHSFDRPEFRQQLFEQGLPVTLTNLARASRARTAASKESE